MKTFFLTCLIATACFGCASTKVSNVKPAASGPRIHDLAPTFLQFWQTVESLPVDVQVQRFKTDFAPKFQGFYDYKFDKWQKRGKSVDEELAKQLREFAGMKTEFQTKSKEISASLEKNISTFLKEAPDLNRDFDVYVTHSLGDMDGGIRTIAGKDYFILGVDGMVRYHKAYRSESPFFHHELFHVYQNQFFQSQSLIWIALWCEGVATYAAEVLNPGAPMPDMLLDLPAGQVPRIEKTIKAHWADIASKLESDEEEDYVSYFLIASENKKIVPRAGYYLGYLLAKDIANETSPPRTISDLAKMQPAEVLPALKRALAKRRLLKL